MRIGVLGLQGDYEEHIYLLKKAMSKRGVSGEVIPVKDRSVLRRLSGIVIPGGESTVIGRLIERSGMTDELREMITQGLPTLGTCAGAILMAKKVRDRVVRVRVSLRLIFVSTALPLASSASGLLSSEPLSLASTHSG